MDFNKMFLEPIVEWNTINHFDEDVINSYISKYESIFVSFGMFFKGLRILPVHTGDLESNYHHTLAGMRGIICMNLHILKNKIK
jgi:hypothetical protein